MNSEIINYSDINVSDIRFENPQKKLNHYYSMINYKKQNNLLCHVTNAKYIEYKDSKIPMMIISIDNKFKKFIEKLEEHTKQIIDENKIKWFNKDIPSEIIKNMFINTIDKDSNNIKTRVAKLNETIMCKIFDSDKIRIEIKDIKRDEKFSCIINIKGIKITKKNLVLDLCMNQIKLYRESIPRELSGDKCIIDDGEEKPYSDEYIDNIDIEESYILDNIKLLHNQKMEDIETINKLNTRIRNIDDEIKLLKLKININ